MNRPTERLPHGGDHGDASAYGRAPWLDLSTGINPHAYPAAVAADALTRLPQKDAEARTLAAARSAYRVPETAAIAAAPGTQALLQWLPHLIPTRQVAVLGPTYQEHAATWSRTANVLEITTLDADADAADLVVIVNPNNPTGARWRTDEIAALAAQLARGRGRALAEAGHPVLIVDEAFMDLSPEETAAGLPHTLVLRSFGKFYGLAGVRLGFAIGAPAIIASITAALGPWAVSGPALAIGETALRDDAWAAAMRRRLAAERARLDADLAAAALPVIGGTDLFRLIETPQAGAIHAALAREGVWTRRFPAHPHWLRIGLPGTQGAAFSAALTRALTAAAVPGPAQAMAAKAP